MATRKRQPVSPPEPADIDDTFLDGQDAGDTGADPEDLAFQNAADDINPDVSQRVWEWIRKKNAQDLEITATLYKEKPEGGKKQCGKWKNQIPDEHNIGLVHGGGRYEMIVTYPKVGTNPPGVKKANFELDKYYDTLKQEAAMSGAVPTLGRVVVPANNTPVPVNTIVDGGGNNTLDIIRTVFSMIQPLINKPQDNTMQQMMQMYQMMGIVMKKSLLDQSDFLAEMQDRMLQGIQSTQGEAPMNPTETEPEKPKTFLEQALPYIMPFLERLTTGTSIEKEATANVINAIPAVQKIITDPKHKSDCKSLIQYLDKQLPKGKTDEILLALKVDRGMYA